MSLFLLLPCDNTSKELCLLARLASASGEQGFSEMQVRRAPVLKPAW